MAWDDVDCMSFLPPKSTATHAPFNSQLVLVLLPGRTAQINWQMLMGVPPFIVWLVNGLRRSFRAAVGTHTPVSKTWCYILGEGSADYSGIDERMV